MAYQQYVTDAFTSLSRELPNTHPLRVHMLAHEAYRTSKVRSVNLTSMVAEENRRPQEIRQPVTVPVLDSNVRLTYPQFATHYFPLIPTGRGDPPTIISRAWADYATERFTSLDTYLDPVVVKAPAEKRAAKKCASKKISKKQPKKKSISDNIDLLDVSSEEEEPINEVKGVVPDETEIAVKAAPVDAPPVRRILLKAPVKVCKRKTKRAKKDSDDDDSDDDDSEEDSDEPKKEKMPDSDDDDLWKDSDSDEDSEDERSKKRLPIKSKSYKRPVSASESEEEADSVQPDPLVVPESDPVAPLDPVAINDEPFQDVQEGHLDDLLEEEMDSD